MEEVSPAKPTREVGYIGEAARDGGMMRCLLSGSICIVRGDEGRRPELV